MYSADLLIQLQELRAELQRLQAQSPWPPPLQPGASSPGEAAPQQKDPLPEPKSYDQAMEILHAMRTMLDALPLEWQVAVVKAITARTVVKARERMQVPPPTALSA